MIWTPPGRPVEETEAGIIPAGAITGIFSCPYPKKLGNTKQQIKAILDVFLYIVAFLI
jgi:hypothetical protein